MVRLIRTTPVGWFPEHGSEAPTKAAGKLHPISGVDRTKMVAFGLWMTGVGEKRRMVLRLRLRPNRAVREAIPEWKMATLALRHPKICVNGAGASVSCNTAPSVVLGDVTLYVPRLQSVGERHKRL